jgi:HAE1 family hydrophobic/amphiphilic exporter-1
MMSARLLGAEAAKPGDAAGVPRSRGGFYRRLDGGYARALSFAMRHRTAVALLSLGVILSAIPLYLLIRQDYLPANADEGEFNVTVSAPQGTSLASMDEILRNIEGEVMAVPGVRLVLSTSGGGFIGSVNEGRAYVRLAPHEERVFSLSRLARGIARGEPLAAFRGNISQIEVMREVRTIVNTAISGSRPQHRRAIGGGASM